MSSFGRKIGVVGLVLGWGVACTQLFGEDKQNTLAPIARPNLPGMPMSTTPTGTGVVALCEAGQVRCEGALLQICADDGSSWTTTQRCAAAALCQVSPGACLTATCSTDEMTCAGAVLQKCNADRTGWDLFATCLSPAHCDAGQRQCTPEPCAPGDRRCDRSETDQSPVLEVCRDDRSDWGPLDACVTRELCDQTLTTGTAGGLELGADGMVQVQAPAAPQAVVSCLLPACAVGEVRCEGARLEFCSEGRTGWNVAEECASAALCEASRASLGLGTPACLPPVCAVGQHNCTETGVLQVCSEDRSGFVDQEACIGAPFCNAVLADQGQAGCRDAPCEAGQMQCNGAQIQVCRDDRTALDDVGAPCESAALCNADDPSNAFCDPPVCRRGATSGDEFHCEGALLQRCNESLTVYDTIQTCVTAALCDASQRANGCKTPVCQPGGHNCAGGFLQTCNADQTGFDNVENCGSQAQCDANAGRCAEPCEVGSQRCNATNGDLEQCNDLLTGWQPIADCPNVQLCDLANGRCDICLDGAFSCADNQLRQCAADGRTFSRQNIPAECALAANGGGGVRACQNNQVVVNPCPLGCTNGRCHECSGTEQQCLANGQIRRCVNGFFGAPTSCSDGNACNGVESCQNNNCVGGQAPNCNDGNACTNDTCNPASGCQFPAAPNRTTCTPAAGTLEVCSNGNRQVVACGQLGCATGSTVCNNCNQGQCVGGAQFQTCPAGLFSAVQNCPQGQVCQGAGNCVFNCAQLNCNDNNPCTNDTCNAQTGCVRTNNANSCSDGNACNGNEVCQNGACSNPPDVSCNDNNACTNDSCNPQNGTCNNAQVQCAAGQSCQGGTCRVNQICTPNSATCTGNTRTVCNAAGTAQTTQNCPAGCNGTACATPPPQVCTPNITTCTNNLLRRCNTTGTGFADQVTCADGCAANGTACLACNPGTSCVGSTLTVCNTAGTQFTQTACAFGCGNATQCRQCTPGATCSGVTLTTCPASGFGRTSVNCGIGSTCNAAEARCVPDPPPPTPGLGLGGVCASAGTTCTNGVQSRCEASGVRPVTLQCAAGCVGNFCG